MMTPCLGYGGKCNPGTAPESALTLTLIAFAFLSCLTYEQSTQKRLLFIPTAIFFGNLVVQHLRDVFWGSAYLHGSQNCFVRTIG